MAELGVQPPTDLYPKPPAPLSQGALSDPTRMLDLFGSVMKNQILQNELKGRAAVGEAALGAFGPNGFDVNSFNSKIQQNPDAAWYALEAAQKGQDLGRAQLERNSIEEQQLRQTFGSLSDRATNEEIYHALTSAVRAGVSPAKAVEALSEITGSKNRTQAIIDARTRGLTSREQSEQGEFGVGPGGVRQTAPLATRNRAGVIEQSLPAYAGPSIDAKNASDAIQSNYSTDVEPLRQSLDKIADLQKKYGAGFLGPGTKGRQELEATIYSYSPKFAKLLGVDEKKLSDYAELEKYLRSGTLTRASSYGAHSDQQLASAAAATPNVGVTDLAVPELIKVQYALRRAEFAQHQQAAARGGIAGEEYLKEKSQWPSHNDPRAFMIDLMSPEERQKLIASIPKGSPEWQRFNNSLRAGYESGVLNRPGRPPAAPPASPAPAATAPATLPKPGKRSEAAPPPVAPAKSDRPTYPRVEYNTKEEVGKQSQTAPPVAGARLAADGHWYVQRPHANGQYMRVIMNA